MDTNVKEVKEVREVKAEDYVVKAENVGDDEYDVVVVGGGIAGYTAALALNNIERKFIWIGSSLFGEKMPAAKWVVNYPGFMGSGKELAALLQEQMRAVGVSFTRGRIDGIFAGEDKFTLTSGEKQYIAQSVILATGVRTKTIPGEEELLGKGVSYCAVCDGRLYKDKEIAVVLSSPEFEAETTYLAGIAKKVYAFPLYPDARFGASNVVKVEDVPIAVKGETHVTAVVCKEKEYPVDGVFMLREAVPLKAICGGLQTEGGYVKVAHDMSTNIKGLFAAGDVTGVPHQFVKAAGEGLVAAVSAQKYLNSLLFPPEVRDSLCR